MPQEVTPTLSVDASQVSVTVLAPETTAFTFAGTLGASGSAPSGGGRISFGAVQGACGPPVMPAPISAVVPSVAAAGSRPSQLPSDWPPSARSTSAWVRFVYVAVQLVEPAAS